MVEIWRRSEKVLGRQPCDGCLKKICVGPGAGVCGACACVCAWCVWCMESHRKEAGTGELWHCLGQRGGNGGAIVRSKPQPE